MFTVNKKIIIGITALSVCLAALLTSCNNSSYPAPGTNNTPNPPDRTGLSESKILTEPEKAHFIIRDTPAKTTPTKTTSTKDGEVLSILTIEDLSITQHERVDKNATDNMRSAIITQGQKRIYSLYDSINNALFTEITAEGFNKDTLPRKVSVDYSCTRNDGKAISITETISYFAAEEPGYSILTTYNFVPLTGERIPQLFYNPDDSDAYNAADNTMYEKLTSKYGEIISYDNVSTSFVDVAANCWHFSEDGNGIKVFFTAGQIAPEQAGDFEIEYSKEELPEFAQKFFN